MLQLRKTDRDAANKKRASLFILGEVFIFPQIPNFLVASAIVLRSRHRGRIPEAGGAFASAFTYPAIGGTGPKSRKNPKADALTKTINGVRSNCPIHAVKRNLRRLILYHLSLGCLRRSLFSNSLNSIANLPNTSKRPKIKGISSIRSHPMRAGISTFTI